MRLPKNILTGNIKTISAQLLALVFSIYVLLAVSITLLHMAFEYQQSKNQVSLQLQTIAKSVEAGLARALWDINMEQLKSEYSGLMSIPEIVGVKVVNEKGQAVGKIGLFESKNQLYELGEMEAELFVTPLDVFSYKKSLSIKYGNRQVEVGSLTLYSNSKVVFDRVKYNFVYIVVSACIKTLGLWVIFLYVSERLLAKPLRQFTKGIEDINIETTKKSEVYVDVFAENELKTLTNSFNQMIRRLNRSEIEKAKISDELVRSEAMFKNLVSMLPVGVFYTNSKGHCLLVNKKWSELTSMPAPVSLGKGWIQSVHKEDQKAVAESWRSAIEKHIEFNMEFRLVKPDGTICWVMGQASADYLSEEEQTEVSDSPETAKDITHIVKGYFCTITDISELKAAQEGIKKLNATLEARVDERTTQLAQSNTELKKAFESLRQAQDQLIETEKMAALGELVAGVAHEINTPLGVALTATTHLDEQIKNLDKQYREQKLTKKEFEVFSKVCLETIDMTHKNIRRASDLVASFKLVAVDQHSDDIRTFNLNEYINEILLSLQPTIKRTLHSVLVDCDTEIELNSYPGSIYQIISNLVVNSLTHGFEFKESGNILIKATKVSDHVRIDYRDDGKGMSGEEVKRVFNPFFTTRRGRGGSGLGAYIIYNLVTQRLNGHIECHSQLGHGVHFVIELPMQLNHTIKA